ncbi:hypothetical protein IW140_005592 [Coemansia sp. RSA 1813]|nr:hypothetical protein EV178_003784 [Coemansia sp. RSA 1646]KAJ1767927.1 hypothetical protein LPJ74_005116 [Coemansia sp. RSA 1843]KAJ2086485.1 hypothetical protein IW138_005645 [Coemansia sp. RSA 986]KAJ2213493.1 hypothetical protein EV179_003812 [Coemansia sp. RSA 487]KAJ2564833.1 hypothetical protein IW140_005592 [Coemansia sp. RSA 1813]
MSARKSTKPTESSSSSSKDNSKEVGPLPEHKKYPLEANGIELMLGGMANAMSLVTPRKGLNIYDNPVKYLSATASVLFGYYAILAFADIYCFKVAQRPNRISVARRLGKIATMGAATFAASLVLMSVFILFGAPAGSQHMETLMAAINLALLAITPAILTLKPSVGAWQRALLSLEPNKTIPEKWASGFFWCTMVTTWAAAYFVPMDWGRPWQRWPIPIVGGAFLGNLISLLYVALRCLIIPIARADFQDSENEKRQLAREMGIPDSTADSYLSKKTK